MNLRGERIYTAHREGLRARLAEDGEELSIVGPVHDGRRIRPPHDPHAGAHAARMDAILGGTREAASG